MSIVTSLATGVKIIGGMKAEMLVDTQLRFWEINSQLRF